VGKDLAFRVLTDNMNFSGWTLPPVAESLARSTSSFTVSRADAHILMKTTITSVLQKQVLYHHRSSLLVIDSLVTLVF